ncbi:hypothetical protein ACOMHN_057215 [Nucella lapillus]
MGLFVMHVSLKSPVSCPCSHTGVLAKGRSPPEFSKRAKEKLAARVAILKLCRKVDGVTFGFVLSYLFWGGVLMQCGDIESNPGPNPPPGKDGMRQTRLSSAGSARSVSLDRPATANTAEPSLSDIMASIDSLKSDMNTEFKDLKKELHDLREDYVGLHSEVKGLKEEVSDLRKKNEDLQKENQDWCAKMTDCEDRIDDLEGFLKQPPWYPRSTD